VKQLEEEVKASCDVTAKACSQISDITKDLEEKTALVETLTKTIKETASALQNSET